MLSYLKSLDLKILFFINGLHTPFWDNCMWWITHRYTWIPLYLGIIVFLYLKKRKEFLLVVVFIILAVVCSDLFASAFMKPLFQRLRPCHNPEINSMLYSLNGMCGGKYGFISSHAANHFALATFLFLYLGREYDWVEVFFIWAGIVSLSRVYLGVHYPSDIAAGALAGILIAIVFYTIYKPVKKKFIS